MKRALFPFALALALAAPAALAQPRHSGPESRAAMGVPDRAHPRLAHRAHARSLAPGAGLLGAGHGPTDHVEGRIAFLRAELAITAAQETAWDAFAETLRANARRAAGPAERGDGALAWLEQSEKRLADRLEGVRATRVALAALQPQLDDAQRKSLDALLSPPRRPAMRR